MLNYQGKLYAKSGDTYLPLKETAADFDRLKDENAMLRKGMLEAWQAMDSYGTAKAAAWTEKYRGILSNVERTDRHGN